MTDQTSDAARARLITDAMVETAARAECAADHTKPWEQVHPDIQDAYRDGSRASLEAVAPMIAATARRRVK